MNRPASPSTSGTPSGAPLAPPAGFQGDFLVAPEALSAWAGASGPFWLPPAAVALPRSAGDLATLVGWAAARGVALVPRGGGTGMPGGNVGPHVVVDLRSLDSARLLEATVRGEGPVIRTGAGCLASRAREVTEARGLELPALPSSAPWCTTGGMAACNAAGARSFRLGPIRSWIRAVEWVRADGRVETLRRGEGNPGEWAALRRQVEAVLPSPLPWPDVRKNSSGYALDAWGATGDAVELAVGSEGTLGVITAVELVPTPPPAARRVVLVGVPELERLPELARRAPELGTARACEYLGRQLVAYGGLADREELADIRADAGLVLFELAGDAGAVASDADALRGLAADGGVREARDQSEMEALWTLRHAASPSLSRALEEGKRSTQFIEDGVVPTGTLAAYIQGLEEILGRHRTEFVLFGHLGDGNLHVNPLVDLYRPGWRRRVREILDEVVALVASLGGTLAGEHGDGRLRTPFLHRFFHPEVIRAFGVIKEALDPGGILNPGVIVPVDAGADPLAGLGEAPGFATGSQGPEGGHR